MHAVQPSRKIAGNPEIRSPLRGVDSGEAFRFLSKHPLFLMICTPRDLVSGVTSSSGGSVGLEPGVVATSLPLRPRQIRV